MMEKLSDSVPIIAAASAVAITTYFVGRKISPSFDSKCFQLGSLAQANSTFVIKSLLNRSQDVLNKLSLGYIDIGSISDPKKISPKWLHRVLSNHFNATLPPLLRIEVSDKPLTGGLRSILTKITLIWSEGEPHPHVDLPKTLVVKTIPSTLLGHIDSVFLGTSREGLFYKNFTNEDIGSLRIPKAYYAEGSSLTGDFAIIMEDLSFGTPCNLILGNQCWGKVDLPESVKQDPVQMIENIFVQLAVMHAKHWRDESLLNYKWLKATQWLQGRDRSSWEYAMRSMRNRWQKIKNAIATGKTKVKWSKSVIETMDQALANTSWENFQKKMNIKDPKTPFTFCHGDFHAANMLRGSDDVFYAFDWSEVGVFCPFTELAQFMVSNATIDLRRKHEKDLFAAYHKNLIKSGVSEVTFPLEDCYERYKVGGIERWLQMLALLASFGLDDPRLPESAISWFEEQVSSFVEDHKDSCVSGEISLMSIYCMP